MLRTHRNVTWISAGSAEAGHLDQHCLLRVLAEELEASKKGRGAGVGGQGWGTPEHRAWRGLQEL